MAVNEVFINGEKIMSTRNDTVSEENLLLYETATDKSGAKIEGEFAPVSKEDIDNLKGLVDGVYDEAYFVSDDVDTIDDADYIPFNDVSDNNKPKKKTLLSSLLAKFGFHTYQKGIEITTAVDLNDYKTEGVYYIQTDARASTITNIPVAIAGKLVVTKVRDSDNFVQQYTDYYYGREYSRIYRINEWLSWVQKPTKEDDLPPSVSATGKSLIPTWCNNSQSYTHNGITFTHNPSDGSVSASGTATADAYCILWSNSGNNGGYRLQKGSYILTGCPSGGGDTTFHLVLQYVEVGSSTIKIMKDKGNGASATFPTDVQDNGTSTNFYIWVKSGQTLTNKVFYPMVRPAWTTNTYEPCDNNHKGNCYLGTCYTAGDVKEKVAFVDGYFVLRRGVRVVIKFYNTNTHTSTTSNPITLNVNGTGAKPIWYGTTQTSVSNRMGNKYYLFGMKDHYLTYVYDGYHWIWDGISYGNHTYEYGIQIPANSNLNSYNVEGVYYVAGADVTTIANRPSDGASKVIVMWGNSGDSKLQFWITIDSNIFVRHTYNDGSTWGSWKKLATTGDLSSYLPLAGGTITGDLTRKVSSVDASKADNNVSALTYIVMARVTDVSDRQFARLEACVSPSGEIYSYWYVRNFDTSGNQKGLKGISIKMNKSGNLIYSFNDGFNANSALGYGFATCSTAEATTAKVASLTNYARVANGYVTVKFTYAVPASSTLNINNQGANAIYYHGSAITANIIGAGDLATFIFDGTYYHLVGIDKASNALVREENNYIGAHNLWNVKEYDFASNESGTFSLSNGVLTVNCTATNYSGAYFAKAKFEQFLSKYAGVGGYISFDYKGDSSFACAVGSQGLGQVSTLTSTYQHFEKYTSDLSTLHHFYAYNMSGVAHTIYITNMMVRIDKDGTYQPFTKTNRELTEAVRTTRYQYAQDAVRAKGVNDIASYSLEVGYYIINWRMQGHASSARAVGFRFDTSKATASTQFGVLNGYFTQYNTPNSIQSFTCSLAIQVKNSATTYYVQVLNNGSDALSSGIAYLEITRIA